MKHTTFGAVVKRILSRPHVSLITKKIDLLILKFEQEVVNDIARMVHDLKDPREYSAVVDVYILQVMNSNLKNRAALERLVNLREHVRIRNFTAVHLIENDAKLN